MTKAKQFGVGFETVHAQKQMECARVAEELGYGTYWVPEDYFFRGAFALASAVACSTKRMRVGLGVVNPFTRHPAVTAIELAALTEIAGSGRTVLGLGASVKFWIENQMGIPYKRPEAAMRETIDLVRRLFRGEAVTFEEGRAVKANAVKFNFPSPQAAVPIHLGVIGPKNLEMAGEIADGVLLSAMTSPQYARFAVEQVRRGAERAGRELDDFEIGALLFISVSENAREAREAVKPFLATLVSLISGQPDSPLFTTVGMPAEEIRRFGETFAQGELPVALVTDWMIDTFAIAGTPEHCREQLAKVIDAGVRSPVAFEIPGIDPLTTIRSVREHLMPHFL